MRQLEINGKQIKIKTHKFEGKKSIEFYTNQIYKALSKIGVVKQYITINSNSTPFPFALVEWIINNQKFKFRSENQEDETKNMGAIAQAIQDDIRQITRGIKDINLVMRQYEFQTTPNKKKSILSFDDKTNTNQTFNMDDLKIDKIVNEKLDPKFEYLTKYPNQKIELLYLRLKEECMKKNMPNHPTFIALKIIRQQRGLKL